MAKCSIQVYIGSLGSLELADSTFLRRLDTQVANIAGSSLVNNFNITTAPFLLSLHFQMVCSDLACESFLPDVFCAQVSID